MNWQVGAGSERARECHASWFKGCDEAAMPGAPQRRHEDEGSVDQFGMTRCFREAVEVFREPPFLTRRDRPIREGIHATFVGNFSGLWSVVDLGVVGGEDPFAGGVVVGEGVGAGVGGGGEDQAEAPAAEFEVVGEGVDRFEGPEVKEMRLQIGTLLV
ncbi:hypothetical protein [Actinocorallia sp. A-T 12471]|uniref:hypothetical protein n=1 Tax=Actinocorallia sp. A-T 12471 TaxID=3089813 RepID=UPI0029CFDEE6|nr:hypothetical protein [Actinocorallia sp. A-T 12471]MDX6745063.1 hypothetical protein [Actinocorallia sp. A-T 12471]